MRKYLTILFLFTSLICYTQSLPQYSFYSTSSQLRTDDAQYTVPFAANNIEPITPVYKPSYSMLGASGDDGGYGPGYDPSDPGMPIGDGIWILVTLCVIYQIFRFNEQKGKI